MDRSDVSLVAACITQIHGTATLTVHAFRYFTEALTLGGRYIKWRSYSLEFFALTLSVSPLLEITPSISFLATSASTPRALLEAFATVFVGTSRDIYPNIASLLLLKGHLSKHRVTLTSYRPIHAPQRTEPWTSTP